MLLSNFESSGLNFTFLSFLILTAAGATAFLLLKCGQESRRNTNTTHDHVRCREHAEHSLDALKYILEPTGTRTTDKPKQVPIHTLLNERALPNARLVRALGLTNTFVSPSLDVHRGFVRRAQGMLRRARGRGWGWVVQVGRGAVEWAMKTEGENMGSANDEKNTAGGLGPDTDAAAGAENPRWTALGSEDSEGTEKQQVIQFDSLIQSTTLLVVFVALLDVESPFESDSQFPPQPSCFKRSDIELVSRNITLLWGLSKRPESIPKHLLEDLNEALGRVMRVRVRGGGKGENVEEQEFDGVPEDEIKRKRGRDEDDTEEFYNPLDFVVPAWETLWRVVATTIAYAYSCGDDSEAVRRALVEFVKDPTEVKFRGPSNTKIDSASLINSESEELGREEEPSEGPNVRCIIAESMRLHPPSKRIGRSKPRAWWACFLQMLPPTWVWPRDMSVSIENLTRVNIHADVGALFRCPKIWGLDATSFVPQRHLSPRVTEEQNEAMGWVFGYGKLRCVAATWAPMAAAVVAGIVVEGIEEGGMEVVRGEGGVGGREGWKGWVVRQKRQNL